MINDDMLLRMQAGVGFVAALDQSGGSTHAALRRYGIPDNAYSDAEGMFSFMHDMRVRIMTSPGFNATEVLGVILFEQTMDRMVEGLPIPGFLWNQRGIVPFLKIDRGLESEIDGVRLMSPIPNLHDLLSRAASLGIFGTKARSVINQATLSGIQAAVAQQFALAAEVIGQGLVPIVELEVLIDSPGKAVAESMLLEQLELALGQLPNGRPLMLKLTLPEVPNLYEDLGRHRRVIRILALSGGYTREEACRRLASNPDMIASFSRALIDDLRYSMTDTLFNAALARAMRDIFVASTVKT